jgi:hypothetical protein
MHALLLRRSSSGAVVRGGGVPSHRLLAKPPRAVEGGLADLLQRDRKSKVDLDTALSAFDDEAKNAPAATTTTAPPAAAAPAAAPTTTAPATPPTQLRSRADRQRSTAAAADAAAGPTTKKRKQGGGRRAAEKAASDAADASSTSPSGPRRCKEAIDAGLAAFSSGDPDAAIALFNLALELPGNGAFRLPGRAREYSCPSDKEEQAALFNLACCYCAKGGPEFLDAAAACLEAACDDAGFDDWDTMLNDPDLQPLGQQRLRAIADARRGAGAAVRGLLAALPVIGGEGDKGSAEVKVSDLRGKPWIMW